MFSRKVLSLVIVFAALGLAACQPSERESRESSPTPAMTSMDLLTDHPAEEADRAVAMASDERYTEEQIRRGEYLVHFGSCNDCHTPFKFDEAIGGPAPDMSRMLSGHPAGTPAPEVAPGKQDMAVIGGTGTSFALPFGTVYAPNLTPDMDTGLGSWTEEMFLKSFDTGTHMGGGTRPILPPMPWMSVASLTREDKVAIFAYLRSIPPIRNGVPTFNPPQELQDAMRKGNEKMIEMARQAKAKRPGKSS